MVQYFRVVEYGGRWNMSRDIQITIDGPAAAGKSTIAKMTAEKLGYTYIDTGAMYRALTYKALQQQVNPTDGDALASLLGKTTIELKPTNEGQLVLLDGMDVSEDIRSQQVTKHVSVVAAHDAVRQLMVQKQRELAEGTGVVMDGRDIGTAVLPNAELKIYMTASVTERALRRFKENEKRGIHTPLAELELEISARDKADSERTVSPLKQAEDAHLIDTTSMSIEEVAGRIIALAEKRLGQ